MSAKVPSQDTQGTNDGQLKVVIVTGDFPPPLGGIADYTASLAEELAVLGVHVTVLSTKVKDQKSRSLRRGVEIKRVMSEWRLSELRRILRTIDEMGPGTTVNLMYGG